MLLATCQTKFIGEEAKMHGIRAATVFWKKIMLAKFLAMENGCKQSVSVGKPSGIGTLPEHQDFKKPKLQLCIFMTNITVLAWVCVWRKDSRTRTYVETTYRGVISESDVIPKHADCNNNIKSSSGQPILTAEHCDAGELVTGKIGSGDTGEIKRKIPTKPGNVQEYRISPDPSETVCASFHQKSGRRGLSNYKGSQCTSMALGAIMVSKTLPVDTWRTKDLDAILRFGDRFHGELLASLDRKSTDPRLALHEIPSGDQSQFRVPVPSDSTKWFTKDYEATQVMTLSKSDEYYGQVRASSGACAMQTDLGDTAMDVALDAIFKLEYYGVVITVGNVSGAIMKDSHGRLRYFDSHCNNKIGRMNLDGTAVLLTFDTTQDFVHHIRQRESKAQCRYEMVGINVNSENTSKS